MPRNIFIAFAVAIAAAMASYLSFQRSAASADLHKRAVAAQLEYAALRPARIAPEAPRETLAEATDAVVVMNGKLMRALDQKRRYEQAIAWASLFVAVVNLILAGIQIAFFRRREPAQPAQT